MFLISESNLFPSAVVNGKKLEKSKSIDVNFVGEELIHTNKEVI